jgi:hypothetical protein
VPVAVQPFKWRASAWFLRAVLIASVTIGLFAMHTLPGMAMSASMVNDQSMGVTASSQPSMTPTAPAARTSPSSAQPATGCSTDHAMCLAVLQSTSTFTALPTIPATVLLTAPQPASRMSARLLGSRAPPDVCLVRLCISRT